MKSIVYGIHNSIANDIGIVNPTGYLLGNFNANLYRNPISLEINNNRIKYYDRKRKNTAYFRLWSSSQSKVNPENFAHFLSLLKGIKEPLSFEVMGTNNELVFVIVALKNDEQLFKASVNAIYPQLYLEKMEQDPLLRIYQKAKSSCEKLSFNFVDINFTGVEFLNIQTPLKEFSADPLIVLYQIFLNLEKGEFGFYQLIFKPARLNWSEYIRKLLGEKKQTIISGDFKNTIKDKNIYFDDHQLPFYEKQAKEKLEFPLFIAVLRVGFFCSKNKIKELLNNTKKIFASLASSSRGIKTVTRKDYYEQEIKKRDHLYMFLNRASFRLGNLFSAKELSALYHFPTLDMLERDWPVLRLSHSYPAPVSTLDDNIVLGTNSHLGKKREVKISDKTQNRHLYICGASGCGKSTLLQNIALQYIEKGQGCGIIDPHGELIQKQILPYIPKERIKDVVYFNALETKPAFNILAHDNTEIEKEFIRGDLIKIITEMLDTSLGVNIGLLLNSILSTLLQVKDSCLEDIYSILLDENYRKNIVSRIKDKRLKRFWEKEFPLLIKQGASITGITNKLNLFLSSPLISPMLTQRLNKINFLEIMNKGKIFLCNLSHGDIHEENSKFLGSLIVSKIQTAGMRRQGNFKDFNLLIDEFQNFLTPSMKTILTGGRKYKLHLTLANQEIKDIPEHILRNVLGASTIVFFGSNEPKNKQYAEKVLLNKFTGEEIGRLGRGKAFVKMEEHVFNLETYPSPLKPDIDYCDEIIDYSKKHYGVSEKEVEDKPTIPLKPKRHKIIEAQEEFDEL